MLYIVTGSRWSMGRDVAAAIRKLEEDAGAEVIKLYHGRRRPGVYVSKFQTAWRSMTPRLLSLRNRWGEDDSVLVIGWYLLPILVLLRLGVLHRPRRLVSIGTFLHQGHLRQAVNRLLRALDGGELEFIVLSQGERGNLIESVGIPPERVHRIVYRGKSSDIAKPRRTGGYIFTGGYTNRDYATFFAAMAPLHYDIIAIASPFNDLTHATPNVDLRIGTPLDEFEELLAGCALLVLPLRAGGEACGQTVLFGAIRHRRPVVATRHEALIDYLGDDYPGFVPAQDVEALRSSVVRVLSARGFRDSLLERIEASARRLDEMGELEDDFVRILAPSSRSVRAGAAVASTTVR